MYIITTENKIKLNICINSIQFTTWLRGKKLESRDTMRNLTGDQKNIKTEY